MAGSSTGVCFVVTNFGESHGPAIGCVIDGCPPGLALRGADIQHDLDRRRPGSSKFVTQRQEADACQILSGVYQGFTTGTPICILIPNTNQRSRDYGAVAHQFRPAHADWGYWQKFGRRDPRGGGRASARLTAPTVAAGAVARKWLAENLQVRIRARLSQLGNLPVALDDWEEVDKNPFFAANSRQLPQLEEKITQIRKTGDSIGAELALEITHVPAGLGNPVYGRLDALLAGALMGINAVKGVEIGAGFAVSSLKGSENGDPLTPSGFVTNNAGGILGGISSGAPITARIAIKPTPSILQPLASLDETGTPVQVQTVGRHDPCVGLRAAPVIEAVAALVLMDCALQQRAQCGNLGTFPFAP